MGQLSKELKLKYFVFPVSLFQVIFFFLFSKMESAASVPAAMQTVLYFD